MHDILQKHIDRLGTVILLFKADPAKAAEELAWEKKALDDDQAGADEITAAALYNALATIRTCPQQETPTGQLIAAITDAREELRIIDASAE